MVAFYGRLAEHNLPGDSGDISVVFFSFFLSFSCEVIWKE